MPVKRVKVKKKVVNNDHESDLKQVKKTKKKKVYFGKDTHDSIVDYQNKDERELKNEIYCARIKPSFEKLVENLIFIHGFASSEIHSKELKSDCVSFLYETLEKFDPSKGTKAFSYFNVVAKNWLIIQSKKRYKRKIRHVSLANFNELKSSDKIEIETYKMIPSQEKLMIINENKEMLIPLLEKIKVKVSNENEKSCINAIITLFTKIEELDFLNKRAVFVYLRELSDLNPKQLSVAMSNIRKYYREIVKNDDNLNFFLF